MGRKLGVGLAIPETLFLGLAIPKALFLGLAIPKELFLGLVIPENLLFGIGNPRNLAFLGWGNGRGKIWEKRFFHIEMLGRGRGGGV